LHIKSAYISALESDRYKHDAKGEYYVLEIIQFIMGIVVDGPIYVFTLVGVVHFRPFIANSSSERIRIKIFLDAKWPTGRIPPAPEFLWGSRCPFSRNSGANAVFFVGHASTHAFF
jgi:hypothetical protein